MLSLHPASPRTPRPPAHTPRIGLAVAGGGPIGGMYELGVLRALDEAIDGLDLTRLDAYVGVSSGAFLAAGLANGMDTAQLCRVFVTGNSDDVEFRPETFLQPALREYAGRAAGIGRVLGDWWRDLRQAGGDARWTDLVPAVGGLVPTGLFDSAAIERFLREVFTRRGRSNDFRTLPVPLQVMAVDLDTGEAVRFGGPGWRDVPISAAVQASGALPGLYPPVEIRGRHFVDGALRRTMHASVVLEQDIDLLIGINPLVPFDASHRPAAGQPHRRLSDGGLPVVLSQTFRTMLQSRMQVGLARYANEYPGVDQLVFEPNSEDGELFFTNPFSFAARRRVCELAYRNTLDDLHRRAQELAPRLAAHGLRLRGDVIGDPRRTLAAHLPCVPRRTDTTARLHRALDETERLLARRR